MARLIVAASAALVLLGTGSAAAAPTPLFRISDPRIDEGSGIAVGRTSPGVIYVQNDSGDTNRFFAVARATGRTAAVVTVPGATNHDWEDIAVAPDTAGRSSVYIADTGVNTTRRTEVRVYRVPEPKIDAKRRDVAVRAAAPAVWRLKFPDGDRPRNAESLAVAPDGTAYLITKSVTGASGVYRLPAKPDAGRVQTLVRIATIQFRPTGSRNPFGLPGQLQATGAAISRDGKLLAVRTYADAFVWQIRDGRVAAAVRTRPAQVALPPRQMGEGITFSDGRLLVDAEGVNQAVYSLPIPTPPRSGATASSDTSGSGPDVSDNRGGGSEIGTGGTVIAFAAGAAVVVAVASLVMARRRRHRASSGRRTVS